MYLLSEQELEKIKDRVALADIKNDSLSVDLVDHICCLIEERVDDGISLTIAKEEVFKEMGEIQLKSIEIETKVLTQNKFIMKKRTKIIGYVALLLLLVGFAMKQLHLLGASVAWGVGVLVAVFGFTLFLTVDRFAYAKTPFGRVSRIIGYLGAASYLLGIGFNVMRYPLSYVLMGVGGLVLLIYFFINNDIAAGNPKPQ
jgi:hypothetical protein